MQLSSLPVEFVKDTIFSEIVTLVFKKKNQVIIVAWTYVGSQLHSIVYSSYFYASIMMLFKLLLCL